MRERVKDLVVILSTAALTALFAALLLAPEATVAKDQAELERLVADGAKLETSGLTLTLDAGGKVHEPGHKPVLTLTAVSSAKETVSVEVEVRMTSIDRSAMFSRAPSFPEPVWTKRVQVKVEAGKTRELELETNSTTAADKIFSVDIRVGKKTVYAAGFAVKAPRPKAETSDAGPAIAQKDD